MAAPVLKKVLGRLTASLFWGGAPERDESKVTSAAAGPVKGHASLYLKDIKQDAMIGLTNIRSAEGGFGITMGEKTQDAKGTLLYVRG